MKKTSTPSKKNLEKKLKSYATVAASVLAADATSQVIYTDIPDTTLVNNGDFFDIDLNNDGTTDVQITLGVGTGSYTSISLYYYVNNVTAYGQNSGEVNTQLNSYSYREVAAFSTSSAINASVNSFSTYGYVGWVSGYTYGTSTGTFRSGQFPGSGQKFAGVKFNIGTAVHYGWIRMDVPTASNRVTIYDFAFDTTAGAQILAGDTGLAVGIDELNPEQMELYAADAVLHFPNSLDKSHDLRVYNLNGQLQEISRVAAGRSQYALRQSYNGIYIVELRNEEGTFRKKLWLESK